MEQALALAEAGVDLFAIETQTDLAEVEQAVAAARKVAPDLPVIVTMTFTRDDRTLTDAEVERGKGILMRLHHVDEDEAFRRLRAAASSRNLKLVEAARRLIAAEEVLSEFDGR